MGFIHFVGLLGLVAFTQAGVVNIAEDFAAIPFTTPEKARGLEPRNTENHKILDGFEAPKGLLPWQVSLRLTRTDGQVLGCGGSVISQQWVLTAAHCTLGMVFCTVRLGMNNLTTPELVIETTSWVNHPQYNPTNLNHDLSLVNLGRLVHYSDLIQPVRLQSIVEASLGVDGLILRASGFGLTEDSTLGGRSSEVLNYVDVRGISSALCMAYYGTNTIIYSTLCTMGLSSIRQGTCQGDSGGPLIRYDAQGVPVQAGVISFVSGQGCHQDHPAGYVYIGYYHPWLTQVTGINYA